MLRTLHHNILKGGIIGVFLFSLCMGVFISETTVTHAQQAANPAPAANVPAVHPATNAAKTANNPAPPVSSTLGQMIGNMFLNVASIITWFGGALLEASIQSFILETGTLLKSGTDLGSVIENLWTLIRDIANLAFIFGLIYAGLAMIIKPDSGSAKRTVASVIIAAILINFSLFFVRLIVDVSNYIAVEVNNTMISGSGSISEKIGDTLGITSFYKVPKNNFGDITTGGNFAFYFMGALLLIVAGFVLAAGAILLIIRFVALIFIMIFSPLLFATTIFPQTADIAGKLWRALFNYAFFAPAYLLLLIISIKVLDGFMIALGVKGSAFTEAMADNAVKTGAIGVIAYFTAAIMFLIFSLQIAQKFGIKGADKVVGAAKIGMGAATVGLAARGLRYGTGKIAETELMKKYGDKLTAKAGDKGLGGWAARQALKSGRSVGNASFDVRNTGAGAALGLGAGIEGYKSQKDKKDAERKGFERDASRVRAVSDIDSSVTTGIANPTDTNAQIAMERSVAGASTEQLQALLKKHKSGTPEYNAIVRHMSASQVDSLMKLKAEDMDDGQKAALGTARAQMMQGKHNITTGPGGTPGNIGKADASDLEALDFNTLLQHAGHLSSKQIDDMKGLTPTAKKTLKDARNTALIEEFRGGPSATQATMSSANAFFRRVTSDAERAKLPVEILTDKEAAQNLNANVLTKILDNDSIDAQARTRIKNNVQIAHGAAAFNNFFNSPLGSRF